MKVEQLMTRHVHTCRSGDPINRVAQIMWEHDCGCVPVVEEHDGGARLVGIVTDRDVCMAAYTQGRPLWDITVDSAMARNVHSCRSTDSIALALALLEEYQVRRLPVLDENDRVVGMISLTDAAREAAREHARGTKEVTDMQISAALEAISAPRTPRELAVAA